MKRCFGTGTVAHSMTDVNWPLRIVVDKPMVASSTCYSSGSGEHHSRLHARRFRRAELLRSAADALPYELTKHYGTKHCRAECWNIIFYHLFCPIPLPLLTL